MECIWVPGTRIGYTIAYRFQMKAVIYEKFGAVLQMKYFVYYATPAIFGGMCVVYFLNSSMEIARHSGVFEHTAQ